MKKIIIFFFILASLSFALDKVVLTAGEWEPFASSKDNDARIGLDIIVEAFEYSGIEVEYVFFPWKRSYELAKSQDYDGSVLWMATDKRRKEVTFSKEPITETKTVFFHRKDLNFDWKTYSDLKKYKVGGTIGYAQSQTLMDAGVRVELANTDELNFKKLLAGRIQVFPAAFIVGYTIMNGIFSDEQLHMITNHPSPMESAPMHIFVSKTHPQKDEILDAFDKGMKKLKESGRYEQLLNKALGLD